MLSEPTKTNKKKKLSICNNNDDNKNTNKKRNHVKVVAIKINSFFLNKFNSDKENVNVFIFDADSIISEISETIFESQTVKSNEDSFTAGKPQTIRSPEIKSKNEGTPNNILEDECSDSDTNSEM